MEIPHVNDIQKELQQKKINTDTNYIKKTNIYVEKLQRASDEYYNNIIEAVHKSINNMTENGNQDYMRLDNEILQRAINWGDNKKVSWHWMHYGFIRKGWRSRDTTPWKRFNIERPFIKAQNELRKKGWYLVDHSNPLRSFGVYISLYVYPPDKEKLWHNLN